MSTESGVGQRAQLEADAKLPNSSPSPSPLTFVIAATLQFCRICSMGVTCAAAIAAIISSSWASLAGVACRQQHTTSSTAASSRAEALRVWRAVSNWRNNHGEKKQRTRGQQRQSESPSQSSSESGFDDGALSECVVRVPCDSVRRRARSECSCDK